MGIYNPDIHRRGTIRLRGYDYSQAGAYFVTLCSRNRQYVFGEINDGKMILNNAGKIAEACWRGISDHYPNTTMDVYIIMPNHVHGIIIIGDNYVGANNYSPLHGTSMTIGAIVRGYKIGVTKWIRKNTDIQHVWQRNYYEHIMRGEIELGRMREYICNNPLNWQYDDYYVHR